MSRHLSEVCWRFARQGTELDRAADGSIWSVTIAELLENVDDWLARLADQIVGGAVLRRLVWGEMFAPLVCYTYNARRADWIPRGRVSPLPSKEDENVHRSVHRQRGQGKPGSAVHEGHAAISDVRLLRPGRADP